MNKFSPHQPALIELSPAKSRLSLLRRLALSIALSIIFFGSGLAFSSLISRFIPERQEWNRSIQYFKDHRDQFNAVVVGNSRTRHGFNPVLLSELAELQGIELKPFVLAVAGFTALDVDYLLKALGNSLEDCLVIVQGITYTAEIPGDWKNDRFAKTHTLSITTRNLRMGMNEFLHVYLWMNLATQFQPMKLASWTQTGETAAYLLKESRPLAFLVNGYQHLYMFFRRSSLAGEGLHLMRSGQAKAGNENRYGDRETLGYAALHESRIDEEFPREYQGRVYSWKDWLDRVEKIQSSISPFRYDGKLFLLSLEEVKNQNPSGILYLEYPTALMQPDGWTSRLQHGYVRLPHTPGDQPVLLRFNSQDDFPAFFLRENRADAGHLNDRGTAMFMELLADRLFPLLEQDPQGRLRLR